VPDAPEIASETSAGVCALIIDRPRKKNALTQGMYAELARLLREAGAREEVRAVLWTSRGDDFTAGNDIGEFLADPPRDLDAPVLAFLDVLAAFSKPIVAGVRGLAVGIGTTALLHCDVVVAARDTTFRTPFVDLGLCPEGGSSLLLPRLLGRARASRMLLLGEPLAAQEALAAGLVTELVDAADVAQRAAELAARLAAKPVRALQASKRLLREAEAEALRGALARESAEFIALLGTPEARAALDAVLQRRRRP
jgi:enoyl-CoA hydratase/carnithine racemase